MSDVNSIDSEDFAITPDSQTVIFRNDPDGYASAFQARLYSARINGGGAAQQISLDNEAVVEFHVTNHYNAAVYTTKLANQTVSFTVVSADGNQRYTLGTQLRVQSDFVITSDDRSLVFLVSRPNGYSFINDIYSLTLAPNSVPKLISPATYPRFSLGVTGFTVTPDGTRVVFTAAKNGAYLYELFSVAVSGGAIAQLNRPFDASNPYNSQSISKYKISADSQRVVFSSEPNDESGSNLSLFSNATTGGTANFIGYGNGDSFVILPNSRSVVYSNGMNDENYNFVSNLYKAMFP